MDVALRLVTEDAAGTALPLVITAGGVLAGRLTVNGVVRLAFSRMVRHPLSPSDDQLLGGTLAVAVAEHPQRGG